MKGPLVTGAGGQLGRALRPLLPTATFRDSAGLDITDRSALDEVDWSRTTAVLNAAAWTAVDRAERDDAVLRAWEVNATGVANLAWHARRHGIPLVHVSTDYVFGLDASAPIGVDAPLGPSSVYGVTKAAGEMAARLAPAHYVVRTGWVFGDGPNFVRTMRRLARERDEVAVVDDQYGRPTYAADLAGAIVALLERGCPWGTYHATGAGDVVSWAGFAAAALSGTGCRVRPVSSAEFARGRPALAPRPGYSALDLSSLDAVGITMRDWRSALAEFIALEERTQAGAEAVAEDITAEEPS